MCPRAVEHMHNKAHMRVTANQCVRDPDGQGAVPPDLRGPLAPLLGYPQMPVDNRSTSLAFVCRAALFVFPHRHWASVAEPGKARPGWACAESASVLGLVTSHADVRRSTG